MPSPNDVGAAIRTAGCLPEIIRSDAELDYWRIAFEQEAGNFDKAWAMATDEIREAVNLIAGYQSSTYGEDRYEATLSALKLRDPTKRGSGTLTAVAAVGLAWCEARPADAMRIAANAIGTDTDTIATMAGAILGAISDIDPPVDVLDVALFRSESKRLAMIAAGDSPPNHGYPDLLHWSAPKTRADALARAGDGTLIVRGLGRARGLEGESILASGEFRWQWIKLEFGQTLLIKSRDRLPHVEDDRTPVETLPPVRGYEQRERPVETRRGRAEGDPYGVPPRRLPDERDHAPIRGGTPNIRDVVSYVEKHIDDDRVVGRALRRVVRKGTTGDVAAFCAALIDLLRSHSQPNDPR